MSEASRVTRGLALALCVLGYFTVPSCYRAEIDLKVMDDAGGGAGSAAGNGNGGASSGDHAQGGAETAEAGAGGAGGEAPDCWDDALDPEQAECQKLGHPTRLQCEDFSGGNWSGCYVGACMVCTNLLRPYPYYFQWHPCCLRNATCYSSDPKKCDPRCPKPIERDKHPRCSATNVSL